MLVGYRSNNRPNSSVEMAHRACWVNIETPGSGTASDDTKDDQKQTNMTHTYAQTCTHTHAPTSCGTAFVVGDDEETLIKTPTVAALSPFPPPFSLCVFSIINFSVPLSFLFTSIRAFYWTCSFLSCSSKTRSKIVTQHTHTNTHSHTTHTFAHPVKVNAN